MKNKIVSYLKRADEKRRLTAYVSLSFSIIFIFLFFLPVLCTFVQGDKESILGYFSFAYLADEFDIIRYAVSLLIISMVVTGFYFITSLIHLFCQEKTIDKARLACLGVLILKTICDVIFVILVTQTSTNIELDWSGFLLPVVDVIFIIVAIYLQVNHSDSSESLFKKKTEETKEEETNNQESL